MSENIDLKEILKKLNEIDENQKRIERKIKRLQKDVRNIQDDIYIDDEYDDDENEEDDDDVKFYDDEECEFEITCPYCGFDFIANDDMKGKDKVKCPKCQKTIELDWNMCDENCENCHHHDNHENLNVAENNDNNYKNDEQNNSYFIACYFLYKNSALNLKLL